MSKSKSAVKSRTIWLNLIGLGVPIVLQALGLSASAPLGMAILAVANVAMRVITKEPITFRPEKEGGPYVPPPPVC